MACPVLMKCQGLFLHGMILNMEVLKIPLFHKKIWRKFFMSTEGQGHDCLVGKARGSSLGGRGFDPRAHSLLVGSVSV